MRILGAPIRYRIIAPALFRSMRTRLSHRHFVIVSGFAEVPIDSRDDLQFSQDQSPSLVEEGNSRAISFYIIECHQ